jgi:hypothetical protein
MTKERKISVCPYCGAETVVSSPTVPQPDGNPHTYPEDERCPFFACQGFRGSEAMQHQLNVIEAALQRYRDQEAALRRAKERPGSLYVERSHAVAQEKAAKPPE